MSATPDGTEMIVTSDDLLQPDNFAHLPPDMQAKVRAKYAEMVAKEIDF